MHLKDGKPFSSLPKIVVVPMTDLGCEEHRRGTSIRSSGRSRSAGAGRLGRQEVAAGAAGRAARAAPRDVIPAKGSDRASDRPVFHERYALARRRLRRPSVHPGRSRSSSPGRTPSRRSGPPDQRRLVEVSGLGERSRSRGRASPTRDELLRFHTPAYLERVGRALRGGARRCRASSRRSAPASYEIAALAAGGCLDRRGRRPRRATLDNAYALVRPPGHHALARPRDGRLHLRQHSARGAARAAAHGVERVAIVDWDAHHGNGTQAGVLGRPVGAAPSRSTRPVLPARLRHGRRGRRRRGRGANVNVPLPPGSGVGAVQGGVRARRAPRARAASGPELVLVACGASTRAPGTRTRGSCCTARRTAQLTRSCSSSPTRHAGGRVVVGHEGGYSPALHALLRPRRARGARGLRDPDERTRSCRSSGLRLSGAAAAPGGGDRRGRATAGGAVVDR